jgi:outer membrane protein
MRKLIGSILLCIVTFAQIPAQGLLTVEEAMSIALKNNYDILVSRTSADIDQVNNAAGNAGMLPTIGVNATDDISYDHLHQKLADGTISDSPDASANTFHAAVGLDWTLFDGGKMFVTKKKLDEIATLGEIQVRDQVMQTLYDVTVAYYDVVRQKEQLSSLKEVIRYNQERVNILQASFNAGLVPKTDLLQAKVDLNVYQENAIVQQTVILASKRTLNQILSRDPETVYEVVDSIQLNYVPNKQELTGKLYASNTRVQAQQKQVDIARLAIREFTAQRLPNLSLSASYSFSQANLNYGSVWTNQMFGPQVGGSLTIPIFYAGSIRRQVQTSQLQLQSAKYGLEATKLQVNTELQNALTNYSNEMDLVKLENDNLTLARENLTISIHRLQYGQTTSLEVRQAEESYAQSMLRFILFQYSAKVAETRLKQLIATL